jgi:hypothetical protein
MRIDTLPFLHYMVRMNGSNETRLLSPIEVDDSSATGGSFVAHVQRDGELLPAYRFHFSIYLGHGEFVKAFLQRNCIDTPNGTNGPPAVDVRPAVAGTVLASSVLAPLT